MSTVRNEKYTYGNIIAIGIATCVILAVVYILFFEDNTIDIEEMTKHINVGDVPF